MKTNKNTFLIIVLIFFHMIKSMVWYGSFSQPWLAMTGITEAQATGVSPITYLIAMASAFLAAYAMLWIFEKTNVHTIQEGIKIALYIGFSFFLIELITEDMFSVRPLALSLINGGNYLLYLVVTGAVLAKWRKK